MSPTLKKIKENIKKKITSADTLLYSQCGPHTSSISTTWKLVGNAKFQGPPQALLNQNLHVNKSTEHPWENQKLRSIYIPLPELNTNSL